MLDRSVCQEVQSRTSDAMWCPGVGKAWQSSCWSDAVFRREGIGPAILKCSQRQELKERYFAAAAETRRALQEAFVNGPWSCRGAQTLQGERQELPLAPPEARPHTARLKRTYVIKHSRVECL